LSDTLLIVWPSGYRETLAISTILPTPNGWEATITTIADTPSAESETLP